MSRAPRPAGPVAATLVVAAGGLRPSTAGEAAGGVAAASVDCQVEAPETIPVGSPDGDHPAARDYAEVIAAGGCEMIWDSVVGALVDGRYTPPSTVRIHWEPEGIAWTVGRDVYVGYGFLQSVWDEHGQQDWGLMYHELAHVVGDGAGWANEGLADWVRYDQGQPPPGLPEAAPQCTGGRTYSENEYECAAAFLGWVDSTYSTGGEHEIIRVMNAAYTQDLTTLAPGEFLEDLTGHPVETLWSQCLDAACAGGGTLD